VPDMYGPSINDIDERSTDPTQLRLARSGSTRTTLCTGEVVEPIGVGEWGWGLHNGRHRSTGRLALLNSRRSSWKQWRI
jgi:hypothetical protein